MEGAMKAKDVMTRNVASVGGDATILQAARLMLQQRISGLPVVNAGGELVGIITEGDFLRRMEIGTERRRSRWLDLLFGPGKLAGEYTHAHGRKVAEVMATELHTIGEETPLNEIVAQMERHRIKRLPVLRGKKLVGIVTRANLMHALATLARVAPVPAKDDAAIRERLLAELNTEQWAPIALINVVVHNGVVELWGTILDGRQRGALKVVAENIPGVKAVHDHLVWIDPMSGLVMDEKGSVTAQ
jgi:CBS domain-containing protein